MRSFLIAFAIATTGLIVAGGRDVFIRSPVEMHKGSGQPCCEATETAARIDPEAAANAGCNCSGKGCNCVNALCGGIQSCQCGGTECSCPDRCNFAGTYSCCSGTHYDTTNTLHCNRYCSRSTCDGCTCPVTCRCK